MSDSLRDECRAVLGTYTQITVRSTGELTRSERKLGDDGLLAMRVRSELRSHFRRTDHVLVYFGHEALPDAEREALERALRNHPPKACADAVGCSDQKARYVRRQLGLRGLRAGPVTQDAHVLMVGLAAVRVREGVRPGALAERLDVSAITVQRLERADEPPAHAVERYLAALASETRTTHYKLRKRASAADLALLDLDGGQK
ncbi:MAG: hypothetical protein ACYC6M_15340 [Terriglobales bacterium]